MKIEISIDRESKVYELKALSLFAESLASGRHIEEVAGAVPAPSVPETGLKYRNLETGKVVMLGEKHAAEPIVDKNPSQAERFADKNPSQAERFADEMAKAEIKRNAILKDETKDFEVMVEEALKMTEDEMKDVPTTVLVAALNTFGIDPTTRPGKNTNAKLRGLLISAIAEAEKGEAAEEAAENAPEEIKPQEDPNVPTVEAQDEATVAEEITIDMLRDTARGLIAANKRKVIEEAFKACGCSNFSTLKNQDYRKFYNLCRK